MATTIDKADAYSRPNARFDEDGQLEIRASAVGGCRRALWYTATGHKPSTTPTESLTVMEAGNALEPVVLRAMERAGWEIAPADPSRPEAGFGAARPEPEGDGPPGRHGGSCPCSAARRSSRSRPGGLGPSSIGRPWGAERSHPDSVAQAAVYTYGTYGAARDAVIATMDTASRAWDYEVIPAHRVERALETVRSRLGELAEHHALHGEDPHVLPERDFPVGSWRCSGCPFLNTCLPGREPAEGEAETEEKEVSAEEARDAVVAYAAAQEALKEPERAKRAALDTLKAWMRQRGSEKEALEGRTVSLVQSTRYSVNYRKLNALLEPETRAEIVTESESEYVRVT